MEKMVFPLRIYTVSELTSKIRDLLEGEFSEIIVEGERREFCAKELTKEHLGYAIQSIETVSYNDLRKLVDVFGSSIVVKNGRVTLVCNESRIRLTYESVGLDVALELIRDATNYLGALCTSVESLNLVMIPKSAISIDEGIIMGLSGIENTKFCIKK